MSGGILSPRAVTAGGDRFAGRVADISPWPTIACLWQLWGCCQSPLSLGVSPASSNRPLPKREALVTLVMLTCRFLLAVHWPPRYTSSRGRDRCPCPSPHLPGGQ